MWRSFENYVLPRIGQRPVSEVTAADVLEILEPIWHTKPKTARRLGQRIRAVLEWAVALEHRADNPCDRLGPVLGPHDLAVRHFRALPHAEVAAVVAAVHGSRALPALKLAFEFLVLTAGRSGEVRGALWAEMDLANHVWTVPASWMKAKREHRVPLCRRAADILDAARTLGGGDSPLVFPAPRGKPLSHTPLYTVFKEHGIAAGRGPPAELDGRAGHVTPRRSGALFHVVAALTVVPLLSFCRMRCRRPATPAP